MDRAEIDENGELVVRKATSTPQYLLSTNKDSSKKRDAGWLPMNGELKTIGSSNAPNLEGRFAVDNNLLTWWQPGDDDKQPTLTSNFMTPSTIHAVRIVWRDVEWKANQAAPPFPIRYRVELDNGKNQWTTVIDRSESTEDLLIDYRECKPMVGTRARLVILGWPDGMRSGIAEFTLFGKSN